MASMITGALISTGSFLVGGLYVLGIHRLPPMDWPTVPFETDLDWPIAPFSSDWWAHRLGSTRWRRVNVPVVGPLFALAAMMFGPGDTRDVLACVAIGMTTAALTGRWIDPLPRLPR
jgi:hypothetical protein